MSMLYSIRAISLFLAGCGGALGGAMAISTSVVADFPQLGVAPQLGDVELAPAQQATSESQTARRVQQALTQRLEELVATGEVPGASAAVILPNGDVVTATAGLAFKEGEIAMTPEYRMFSGSIGKTYFAAIAVDLLQSGKLTLDDPVSKHVGEEEWFKQLPGAKEITIAHLMRHQSGLPRYVTQAGFWGDLAANPDKVWSVADRMSHIAGMPSVHEPGEGWAYSDTNFIVLAAVIEKVTGETCYDLITERILKPHELTETTPGNSRNIDGLAQGYAQLFGGLGIPTQVVRDGVFFANPQFEWGGGGFVCTPRDLARWAKINYTGGTFEHDYLPLMRDGAASSNPRAPGAMKYGLGVMLRETPAGDVLGHDGVFPGYLSSMGYFVDAKIAAAIQVNTDNSRALGKSPFALLTELVQIAERAAEGQ